MQLGQRIGARFPNLVSRVFNDPARIHERLFARLRDDESPVFASFLPYARRFKPCFGDVDLTFRKQLACFAPRFVGVLQAPCYRTPTLGINMQGARRDRPEDREDSEEENETQNHLTQARPEHELVDGRHERISGDKKNSAAYRNKPLRA